MRIVFLIFSVLVSVLVFAFFRSAGQKVTVNTGGITIATRFPEPSGFKRLNLSVNSFGGFIRTLGLKPAGALVHYYNGAVKPNDGIYSAVVDLPLSNKDLHQCADAVMHVRAEYLFAQKRTKDIHFKFTSGFVAEFSKWEEGNRISVKGNSVKWVKSARPDRSHKALDEFMEVVYTYCGTLSLSHELKKINYADLRPGDVLIKGGSPGHAELVMDMVENAKGEKMYLLAQSYMPAQEMQVLQNPENKALSPWYKLNTQAHDIITPQWDFTTDQCMRFNEE